MTLPVPHEHRIRTQSENPRWRTPDPCYQALDVEFQFAIDLAADETDHKVACWFGPGAGDGYTNSLVLDWAAALGGASGFLNPPYSVKRYRETKDPAMLIEHWARKCWQESLRGATIVGVMPFSMQTRWWKRYVMGGASDRSTSFHAATEYRPLPHRIDFDPPVDYAGKRGNSANVNTAIVVWRPWSPCFKGIWMPQLRYWSYRPGGLDL